MTSTNQTNTKKVNVLLWTVQVVLALLFLFAGSMKLIVPLAELAKQSTLPGMFLRFIGAAEVLGAIGLILPGILRVARFLTPLAAAGLVTIMAGATAITMSAGSPLAGLMPLTIGVLLGLIAYRRRLDVRVAVRP